ncbi:MAG: hypothetical protein KKA05_10850 [Alphaproteobacteria bacterium]|nr:hypothetical protein [Alphaproteobacteria bacterium]MBU0860146.1 hypothetical protein [Alphaproteobacteria bacterium]
MTAINLKYTKYVAGKDFGEQLRAELKLPEIDKTPTPVTVNIPEGFSCNGSFIEGLFTASVLHCGSRSKFLTKYVFPNDMSNELATKIDDMITYALRIAT